MALLREIQQQWHYAFMQAARERGMKTAGGFVYVDDGIFVAFVALVIPKRSNPLRSLWWVEIKPLELDNILRAAFLPDLVVGPAKRRSLRVNGAFSAPGLKLGRGEHNVDLSDDPLPTVNAVLDTFNHLRTKYLLEAPHPQDFIDQVRSKASDADSQSGRLREALALIVANRNVEAARLLQHEIDHHRRGPMGGPDGGVFDLLAKYLARDS